LKKLRFGRFCFGRASLARNDDFALAALCFNLGTRGGAERVRRDGKLASQIAGAKNLDPVKTSVGKPRLLESSDIDRGAVFELIQIIEVDGQVTRAVALIIETTFRNAADEGHLTTFKPDSDGAAGAGGLAFATATAGFAVTAGFTLAEPLAAVLGAWARL